MSTIFLHRVDIGTGSNLTDVILVHQVDASVDGAELREMLLAEIESGGFPDQIIFFVNNEDFKSLLAALRSGSHFRDLLVRVNKKSTVFVSGFDSGGEIRRHECINEPLEPGESPAIDLGASHRHVITSLFRKNNGFINCSSSIHFALPSGKYHVDQFVRVSRLITNTPEIYYLATSLLPFMSSDVRYVYVDTPALFPIVGALSDLVRKFEPDRSPLIGVNFRSYNGASTFSFKPQSVVLLSCSSTGSLACVVRDRGRLENRQIVHFLWLGDAESRFPVICDLNYDAKTNAAGFVTLPYLHEPSNCKLCRSGSFAISLSGDYFELPSPQPLPVNPIKDDAPKDLAQVMARYATKKVFQVGLGENWSDNPREFFIDPARFLECKEFLDRLDYILDNGVPASLDAIVTMNSRSKILSEYVINRIKLDVPSYSRDDLPSLGGAQTARSVLVVSAVVESGRSLNDATRDLRKFYPSATHCFLVGFVKYSSESARQALRNSLIRTNAAAPNRLMAVDEILLPLSSNRGAWDAEIQLLKSPLFEEAVKNGDDEFWNERLDVLRERSRPIAKGLFVRNAIDIPLDFTPGFIFWPPGINVSSTEDIETSVYFTVASVLQNLRNRGEESPAGAGALTGRGLRNDLFQQSVLDPKSFLRFNDGLIQAAFLRACRPAEINYRNDAKLSAEIGRTIAKILAKCSGFRGSAAAEFLLAICLERLTIRQDDLNNALTRMDERAPARVRNLAKLALQKSAID